MSWLASIFFKNPYYLLFAIIPMLYGAWYVWKHRITFTSFQSSGAKAIDSLPTSSLAKLRHLPTILHVLGLLALIVALARPQTRDDWKDSKIRGIDIMLAMDVSTSMTATDFRPNRLAVAKKMASQFVEKRVNDRLGFVQFAGESFTQCPLTIDHRVVQNLLLDTKPGILKDGTAMGMGISTAVYRLKESDAKSKVIVMLTDGVNNQGNVSPQTAAEIASSFGIKVYTIGIGSNAEFSETPYGRMKNEIDEEALKKIALE
ncbi:MAG: VWA domain-containing protein, partial [Cyclobacteriaceae bacterium]